LGASPHNFLAPIAPMESAPYHNKNKNNNITTIQFIKLIVCIIYYMVATSEALGVWQTGLTACLIKQMSHLRLDFKDATVSQQLS